MYCRNFTVLSSFFDVKKQRPTMNLEKCYQCSANIELNFSGSQSLFFPSNVKNSIAVRSTNQIIEISAP